MDKHLTLSELESVLDALESARCPFWLEGGWGVDALVGRQTRPHGDVDVDFDARWELEVLGALAALGYAESVDERPTRIELLTSEGACVDLHPLHFEESGDARQVAPDGSAWLVQREWFTSGSLGGRGVPCFTVEAQRHFHRGYEPRDVDRADLQLLDQIAGSTGHASELS